MRLFRTQSQSIEVSESRLESDIQHDLFELERAYQRRRFRMLQDMARDEADYGLDRAKLLEELRLLKGQSN